MDSNFAPPSGEWVPLSPRYLRYRQLTTSISWGVFFFIFFAASLIASSIAPGIIPRWVPWLIVAVGVAFILFRLWRTQRIVRAMGYQRRDSDLYIRQGLWFKNITVVPYGRMQLVEMTSGPLEKAFGIANVRLVTAAAATQAVIPGLDIPVAEELRDDLTSLGESQAVGL